MGLPAVRHERPASRVRKPHLRWLNACRRRTPARKRSATARTEAARGMFRSFAILMALGRCAGLGPGLAVGQGRRGLDALERAAQRHQERALPGRHARGAPERLGFAVAYPCDRVADDGHGTSRQNSLINLTPKPGAASAAVAEQPVHAAGPAGVDKAIKSLMDLTAGEAQVLLVGDVGLASSK